MRWSGDGLLNQVANVTGHDLPAFHAFSCLIMFIVYTAALHHMGNGYSYLTASNNDQLDKHCRKYIARTITLIDRIWFAN
jgi:hypothetical protein